MSEVGEKGMGRVRKRSSRGKLRTKVGRLHFLYLKKIRNNDGICQICLKPTRQLGRFHVLRVGTHPRLEFCDDNVLLAGWWCCHHPWHHGGGNDEKVIKIEFRIKEILGDDYKYRLLEAERCMDKISMLKLEALEHFYSEAIT